MSIERNESNLGAFSFKHVVWVSHARRPRREELWVFRKGLSGEADCTLLRAAAISFFIWQPFRRTAGRRDFGKIRAESYNTLANPDRMLLHHC